jgi:probable F420-dependent oxidoreductase
MLYFFSYPETYGAVTGDLLEPGALGLVAHAAEQAGFDGISLTEHPVPGANWLANGGHQTLDPFVALGYVAALTTRLKLLTHIAVAPYRNPFLLAKAAATVDKMSDGRFVLGLGAGYQKSEFYALGVDFEERNALFDETLEVLPLHWHGEPFSYTGRHFDARNVVALPKPVQDPIPVWIGGNAKLSRRRAAERAQGWMPMIGGAQLSATARTVQISDPGTLAGLITEVQDMAAAAGRGPVEIAWSYGDQAMGKDPVADADRHREAIAELAAIGVTALFISARGRDAAGSAEFVAAFGETYLR